MIQWTQMQHTQTICTIYSETDPADVALVSPQTPLIPRVHPLLSGGYSKAISLDSFLLAYFQWVFCVFTCNHPPQQTLHPEPSALPSSQAFREEGPFYRYTRSLAIKLIRQTLCGSEGGSLDLPNSERCEAAGIAYIIHRPRF